VTACDSCLRRTWLLARLGHHLELARSERRRLHDVLALEDAELVAAIAGRQRGLVATELESLAISPLRAAIARAGLDAVCRHDARYPQRLRIGPGAPAVLHVGGAAGGFERLLGADVPSVAIVGARKASFDGLDVARALARGLAAAGVTVVSGMALGIDSAAHEGALDADGPTVAVLAGAVDVPYPAAKRRLHQELVRRACVVSEMPPGFRPLKWAFPARNRTIAALADVTVIVEAAERSGSLITADFAAAFGREVAAVPGRVTAPLSRGTNALIMDGASLVRDARDVLDLLFGAGGRHAPGVAQETQPTVDIAAGLPPALRELLGAVDEGRDTVAALAGDSEEAGRVAAGLTELELMGLVSRRPGGRYARVMS
jgi:DNA processing protein